MIDILDEPWLAGGIRHAADILGAYFESADRDDRRIIEYARDSATEPFSNGSVFSSMRSGSTRGG